MKASIVESPWVQNWHSELRTAALGHCHVGQLGAGRASKKQRFSF